MKPRPPAGPVSAVELLKELKTAARLVDLGMCDYRTAYQLQQALVEKRWRKEIVEDLFLVTEHPSTFTLGRRGGLQNLVVSEQFLQARNIPIVHIERGGDITYHGPGQLVVYPIIHLRQSALSVARYVYLLEELMISLALEFGVMAGRDLRNHGIWIKQQKLGSVGIAIRHGVSFHGLALNVQNSLEPFSWVNPCGLRGVAMTSLSRECGHTVALELVRKRLAGQLQQIFTREFIPLDKDHLNVTLPRPYKDGQTEVAQAESAKRPGI